jgi:hypothetical protein
VNESFKKAVDFTLRHEGGYTNDRRDSGGETKYGISKRAYPNLIISSLTEEEARVIYFSDYWMKAKCQTIASKSPALAAAVFDFAVNAGVERALKELTQIESEGVRCIFFEYLLRRVDFYRQIAVGPRAIFLKGWLARVMDLWKEFDAASYREAYPETGEQPS